MKRECGGGGLRASVYKWPLAAVNILLCALTVPEVLVLDVRCQRWEGGATVQGEVQHELARF